MAELVGVWRRGLGRLWLSLHGFATLGAGVEPAADGRAGRWPAGSSRIDSTLVDCPLPISRSRRQTARSTHLVSRRQTTLIAFNGTSRQMEERSSVRRPER